MKPASINPRTVKTAVAIALVAGGVTAWTWASYTSAGEMNGMFQQSWEVAWVEAHNRSGAHVVRDVAELTFEECMAAGMNHLDAVNAAADRAMTTMTARMIVQVGAAGLCLAGCVVGLAASRRPKSLPPVFAPEVFEEPSVVDRPHRRRVSRQKELIA